MPIKIDFTKLEEGKPHWLDPREKNKPKYDAIRKKHRDRWLAKLKSKRSDEVADE